MTGSRWTIDVDWRDRGDEWMSALMALLSDSGAQAVHATPTERGFAVSVESPAWPMRLDVELVADGTLRVAPVGDDPPDAGGVAAWRAAVNVATTAVAHEPEAIPWAAVLGPNVDGQLVVLERPESIGGMELVAAEEPQRHEPTGSPRWWPIFVRSTTRARTARYAYEAAAEQVRTLAALLSVVSLVPIKQRLAPRDPSRLPYVPRGDDDADAAPLSIPDWVASAWAVLGDDDVLRRALLAYHEGALLVGEHPSMAFVAYAATLERIGGRYRPLDEPCPNPDCRARIGARRAFRHALELSVADPAEVTQLVKSYDRYRTATAHVGELHGWESTSGPQWRWSMFNPDPRHEFTIDAVRHLGSAARHLVELGLTGRLPAPVVADGEASPR